MSKHDPTVQVGNLEQCLSSAKRPIGIFLGAGCPMAVSSENCKPLIPDIAGITKSVCDHLQSCDSLKTVIEHLNADGYEDPTVEDFLTHIRALRLVVGTGEVRGLSAEQLDRLDENICDRIQDIADRELPFANTPYHRLASWTKATERDYAVEIFTTNYDILMEQALEESGVPYFDGFAGALKPSFDLRAIEEDCLPLRWARLWKLHGSINWHQTDKGVFRGEVEGERRVIHPSHLKYQDSRRMPYLAMMDRLRRFMRHASAVLILCGYSFRDQHVNEAIMQGLQSTHTTAAFALLFGSLEEFPDVTRLATEQPNLTVLARDGAVIGTNQGSWVQRHAQEELANDGEWVKWIAVDHGNESEISKAEFKLGDFAVLGRFFQRLIGQTSQPPRPSNAE